MLQSPSETSPALPQIEPKESIHEEEGEDDEGQIVEDDAVGKRILQEDEDKFVPSVPAQSSFFSEPSNILDKKCLNVLSDGGYDPTIVKTEGGFQPVSANAQGGASNVPALAFDVLSTADPSLQAFTFSKARPAFHSTLSPYSVEVPQMAIINEGEDGEPKEADFDEFQALNVVNKAVNKRKE